MATKKELSDRILTELRQTSKDRHLSRRYVLHVFESKMKDLIVKKLRDRSLHKEGNIYTDIDCYELERIESKICDIIEFRNCNVIMKGKKRLPELLHSKYGNSIKMVTNLNNTIKINKTTPSKLIRDSKRLGYNKKEPVFYVKDGFLYVLNKEIEAVYILILTLDKKSANECGCGEFDECVSELDYDVVGSDKMYEIAYSQTIQEIANTYMNVRPDENPDNNENRL